MKCDLGEKKKEKVKLTGQGRRYIWEWKRRNRDRRGWRRSWRRRWGGGRSLSRRRSEPRPAVAAMHCRDALLCEEEQQQYGRSFGNWWCVWIYIYRDWDWDQLSQQESYDLAPKREKCVWSVYTCEWIYN